ncbi:TetR/AcrR family transcriptional regulator [Actinacidiphila glaucinigra]|uniref:TetR/AcrR family transcriptional regulator n=1 Tax=Actinacidiphila glaucinigra TaxID=235986 RepID=UPI00366E1823
MGEGSVAASGEGRREEDPPRPTRSPQIPLADSEILQRGLEAFAELSYSGASVRVLARRMSVSHNFINDRFGSKANFWRAVVDHAIATPHDQIMEIFDRDLDDVDKFKSIVRQFYRASMHRPDINRIISDESVVDSDRLNYLYSKYTGQFMAEFEPLAKRLMNASKMTEIPMDVLYSALTGPVIVLSQQQMGRRIRGMGDPSDAELLHMANTLAEVVIHGLLTQGV